MASPGLSPFDVAAKEEEEQPAQAKQTINQKIQGGLGQHPPSNPRQSSHVVVYIIALLCAPIAYLAVSGYVDLVRSLHRCATSLDNTFPIQISSSSETGDFDFAKIDEEIIEWHSKINEITDKMKKMALVYFLTDNSVGIEWVSNHHMEKEKGGFHPPRDLLLLTFFLLSAALYFSRSPRLCYTVLIMNIFMGLLCMKLKFLNDTCEIAVIEKLDEARMTLMTHPMHLLNPENYSNKDAYERALTLSLLKRTYLIEKLEALIQGGDIELAIAIRLPLYRCVAISDTVVLSIIAASTIRAVQVLLRYWATEAMSLTRQISGSGGSGGIASLQGDDSTGGGEGGSHQHVLKSNLSFGLSTIFERKKYN